jgi:hypothetical protein
MYELAYTICAIARAPSLGLLKPALAEMPKAV